ncbi:MAG: hypothetical protein ACK5M4_02445 [Pseudorhodobacter sp.]
MRHEWIFEILEDLRAYATRNSLPALATQAEEALRIARAEIAADRLFGKQDNGRAGASSPRPPRSRH